MRLQQEQSASRSPGIGGTDASAMEDASAKEIIIDPKMENIIEQMFQRCYRDSCFEQAIGNILLKIYFELIMKVNKYRNRNLVGYKANR